MRINAKEEALETRPKKRRQPPMRVRVPGSKGKRLTRPKANHYYLRGLRDVRMRKGLRQEDLAALSGVSRVSISHLEWLDRRASPKTIGKLMKALGVEARELISPKKRREADEI